MQLTNSQELLPPGKRGSQDVASILLEHNDCERNSVVVAQHANE
jgi:hypothetical protein